MIDLTDKANSCTNTEHEISYPADGLLEIKLFEIPPAGYSWNIEQLSDGINVLSNQLNPTSTDALLVGGGANRVITFELSTNAEITLRHGRDWMRGKDDDDAVLMVIKIKNKVKN